MLSYYISPHVVLRIPLIFAAEAIVNSFYKDETERSLHGIFGYFAQPDIEDFNNQTAFLIQGLLLILAIFILDNCCIFKTYAFLAAIYSCLRIRAYNLEYVEYCLELSSSDSSLGEELLSLKRTPLLIFSTTLIIQVCLADILYLCCKCFGKFQTCSLFRFTCLSPILSGLIPYQLIPYQELFIEYITQVSVITLFSVVTISILRNQKANNEVNKIAEEITIAHSVSLAEEVPFYRSLQMYWIVRVSGQAAHMTLMGIFEQPVQLETENIISELLANGCDSAIATVGMASVISLIFDKIAHGLSYYLLGENEEVSIIFIMFLIVTCQTGLSEKKSRKRLEILSRNVYHVLTDVSACFLEDLQYISIKTCKSFNKAACKHIRLLVIYICYILLQYLLLNHLWDLTYDTWLQSSVIFAPIRNTIKVIFIFLKHAVAFVYFWKKSWENQEDCVRYLNIVERAFKYGSHVIYIVHGLYFLYRLWVSATFTSDNIITICILAFTGYEFIWKNFKQDYESIKKHITATKKIKFFPEATQQELSLLDDVCAICSKSMKSARITKCNHYFHACCLLKWIRDQNFCAACYADLYGNAEQSESNHESVENQNQTAHLELDQTDK